MNGIINILKPPGMTSQNVVSYVKRLLRVSKAGHTGTLDPGAAGVLPVCIGKATRVSEYLMNDKKSYRAEMCMGLRSDTLDKYGELEYVGMPELDNDNIYDVFNSFKGRIRQIPPMYSAVRHNGERLYDLARQGIVVDRKLRDAVIYEIKILKIRNNHILFDVTCSKGTYIRSLCSDIGKALGTDAIMSFLVRTATGPFAIDNAVTLDEFKELADKGDIKSILKPVESGLQNFSRVYIDNTLSKKARNGVGFALGKAVRYEKGIESTKVLIFDDDDFIAVGGIDNDNYIVIEKVFA